MNSSRWHCNDGEGSVVDDDATLLLSYVGHEIVLYLEEAHQRSKSRMVKRGRGLIVDIDSHCKGSRGRSRSDTSQRGEGGGHEMGTVYASLTTITAAASICSLDNTSSTDFSTRPIRHRYRRRMGVVCPPEARAASDGFENLSHRTMKRRGAWVRTMMAI